VRSALDGFRFNEACRLMYEFAWHDFCDWYVEAIKADLYQAGDDERREDALNICCTVLARLLKLLHPVMPFITEEIWSHLRSVATYPAVIDQECLFEASFPVADPALVDEGVEARFGLLQEVVTALRTIRSENNVPPDRKGAAVIIPGSEQDGAWLRSQSAIISAFARLDSVAIDAGAAKPGFAGQSVVRGNQVYLVLEGLIDRQVELERLSRELARVEANIEGTRKRLESDSFSQKAPADVVAKEREKYEALLVNRDKMHKSLAALKG
jgi:valyl-tRNA synthetase